MIKSCEYNLFYNTGLFSLLVTQFGKESQIIPK